MIAAVTAGGGARRVVVKFFDSRNGLEQNFLICFSIFFLFVCDAFVTMDAEYQTSVRLAQIFSISYHSFSFIFSLSEGPF